MPKIALTWGVVRGQPLPLGGGPVIGATGSSASVGEFGVTAAVRAAAPPVTAVLGGRCTVSE